VHRERFVTSACRLVPLGCKIPDAFGPSGATIMEDPIQPQEASLVLGPHVLIDHASSQRFRQPEASQLESHLGGAEKAAVPVRR
jgi:hypothetical protein